MPYTQPQLASTLVMVPPVHFAYNAQTGKDNAFQNKLDLSADDIREYAMAEYTTMVDTLREHGLQIIELAVPPDSARRPDAVFPNNWFTTAMDGELTLFPMATENRRREVCPEWLMESLHHHGFAVSHINDVRKKAAPGVYLEGTGALVFDHPNRLVYAALSQRCNRQLGESVAKARGYQLVAFDTQSSSGKPVYHTNVLLSIGENFAIVCADVIAPSQREAVVEQLAQDRQVVTLSENQMMSMCGNVLQVTNEQGQALILLSQSAMNAFTSKQRQALAQHGTLVPLSVPTIEQIGGGSVRCMVAEVFLPRASAQCAKAS